MYAESERNRNGKHLSPGTLSRSINLGHQFFLLLLLFLLFDCGSIGSCAMCVSVLYKSKYNM